MKKIWYFVLLIVCLNKYIPTLPAEDRPTYEAYRHLGALKEHLDLIGRKLYITRGFEPHNTDKIKDLTNNYKALQKEIGLLTKQFKI